MSAEYHESLMGGWAGDAQQMQEHLPGEAPQ